MTSCRRSPRRAEPTSQNSPLKVKMEDISRVTEKQMILDALNRTNQNRTRAAELLGISRRTLQNKIKEYGLYVSSCDIQRGEPQTKE